MTHTARSLLDPAIWNGQLLGADGWTPGSAKLCVIEKATGAELGDAVAHGAVRHRSLPVLTDPPPQKSRAL